MTKEHFKQLAILTGLCQFAALDEDLYKSIHGNLSSETKEKLVHFSTHAGYLDTVEKSTFIKDFTDILNETLTKLEPYTKATYE